jgi:hypothetical protein
MAGFQNSNFEFVWNFELRISNFCPQSLIVCNPKNSYFTPSIRMLPITVFGMKHHS